MKQIKDNKIVSYIIIGICIVLMFSGQFFPIPGIDPKALGLIFIFVATMVLWMVFSLVWPSLLCFVALGFLAYDNFGNVLATSFGNQTWVFLLFTFVLSFALVETSIFKRIALAFVNNKLAKKNGHLFVFLFMLAVLILGCFTSPTVLFAVMLPILKEILFLAKVKPGDKLGKCMMLGMCFTIAISSGMTPIAHVFCITAISTAEKIIGSSLGISMLNYVGFAIPLGLMAFGLTIGTFLLIMKKKDVARLTHVNVRSIKRSLPKMDVKEIIAVSVFAVVIVMWVLPSILSSAAPDFYKFMNTTLGLSIPPLIGCVVLAIIQIKNRPILDIASGMKQNVPWSSLLVCAAALALGAAFGPTGLNDFLTKIFKQGFSNVPWLALLVIFVVWTLLETNFSSNLVTATVVATLAAQIIYQGSTSLNFNAIICIIGCLSGLAFATPPAHPNTALTIDSGYANSKQTFGYGMMAAGYSAASALLVGYPIAMCIM